MKLKPTTRWSDLFFVFLVLLLIILPYYSYKRINMMSRSYDEVNKTNIIKLKLSGTMLAITNAETAQRGFLLSGDSMFIEPLKGAFDEALSLADDVDSLTAGDQTQHLNNIRLHYLLQKRFHLINFISSTPRQDPGVQSFLKNSNAVMNQISAEIDIMILHQDQLLSERLRKKEIYSRITPVLILVVSFFSLLIILVSFFRIRNDAKRLYKLNSELHKREAELSVSNRKLAESTELLNTILQNTRDGIMQLRLIKDASPPDFDVIYCTGKTLELGKDPAEVIGKRLGIVFPEILTKDRRNDFSNVLATGTSLQFELNYRKDKIDLWLQIYVDKSGQDSLTITFQNITREKKASIELEKATLDVIEMNKEVMSTSAKLEEANKLLAGKNLELESMNAELSSFAYVASHDLQEPLRKIKTFSNRILDKEKDNFSTSTADYFSRIESAAGRMQRLIDDLLSLSRATSGQMIFVETDLNKILREVLRNMKDVIDEKNAVITADPLPVLNVIPVQMQQLFQNIVGNSLKYSKAGIPPVISIHAEEVTELNIASAGAVKGKWLKLVFTDNGIGFDPKYSTKIFELFQRLHGKNEYEGTGIGLAICRKIAANHNGVISATATPGEGAVFTVYISETLTNSAQEKSPAGNA